MQSWLLVIQIILSIALTGCVLLQAQGSGFGTTWSGGGETYHTKRGVEKVVYYLTMVLLALFTLVAILSVAV